MELEQELSAIENLIGLEENQSLGIGEPSEILLRDYEIWLLLMNLIPGSLEFTGQHGSGKITFLEYKKVIEESYVDGSLHSCV
jgi:hypothetical protein